MRSTFSLLSIAIANFAFAGSGYLSTKTESSPVEAASSPVGVGSIFQVLLALALVVVILKFLLPKVAGKLNSQFSTKGANSIKIEETVQYPGGSLLIVKARNKTLLLGSTSNSGIVCLSDLTEHEAAEPVDEFAVVLQEATQSETSGSPFPTDIQAALNRLNVLDGGLGSEGGISQ